MFYDKFIELCNEKKVLPAKVATECGFNRASITNWKNKIVKKILKSKHKVWIIFVIYNILIHFVIN